MLEFYASAGESDAVIQSGRRFLANFPKAPQRTSVALFMADAYSRKNDTASEFAIYDSVLQELAAKAEYSPLGSSAEGSNSANEYARAATNTPEMEAEPGRGRRGPRYTGRQYQHTETGEPGIPSWLSYLAGRRPAHVPRNMPVFLSAIWLAW